jgi:hypothetical protein
MEPARHTKRTITIVVCLYVGIGFVVAVSAAVAGQPIGAFLGFLIISGSLVASVVLTGILRLGHELASVNEQLDRVRAEMQALTARESHPTTRQPDTTDDDVLMIDLAALGRGDPSPITAATLNVSTFPRLLRAEDDPSEDSRRRELRRQALAIDASLLEGIPAPEQLPRDEQRDLVDEWHTAARQGNVAACRDLLATIEPTIDEETTLALRAELRRMELELEESLRERFSALIQALDYAGALAIGERICTQLPDYGIADEFRAIKPHLLRRLAGTNEESTRRLSFARSN